jgi:tetratricopeptide (TPR) repeat protein
MEKPSRFVRPTSEPPSRPTSGIIVKAPESQRERAFSHLELGDELLADGDANAAAAEYLAGLELMKASPSEDRIEAYVRLGHANRHRERTLAAVHCYQKALELDPLCIPALRSLVDLHASWGEWAALERLEEALFAALDGDSELHAELIRAGDRWWSRARDAARASGRYTRALRCFPRSEAARMRLRALEQATGAPTSQPAPSRPRISSQPPPSGPVPRTTPTRAPRSERLTAAWFQRKEDEKQD